MAGYNDTRRMIVKTLMGRPTGTEIQPEDHQAFALQITDYVRSVELLAGNATPIGFAEADTVPVRPNNGQALYLSQVNRGETVTFNNFIDQDGNAITVVSNENTVTLVNLLWNTLYWTKQETRISLEKSVHGDDIVDGAVTTPKIADGAVTNTKLSTEVQAILNDVANKQNITDESLATIAKTIVGAINEVYNGGLKDASIATSKIKDGAVTEGKLASSSVTNEKIADKAIQTKNIADKAIQTKNIADKAIQTKNIADKAISPDNLNAAVTDIISNTVKYDKAQTLTDAQKLQARRNIGALNAAAGAVHTTNLANGDVTTEKLADGAVTTPKITNDAVTTEKVKAGAVTEDKLASSSVTNAKIADNTITEPKLDTTLQAKVNNNVKTVEQTLTDEEIAIVSKNLKFRDANGNFFADKASYDAVANLPASEKPNYSMFGNKCVNNTFGHSCENYIFGNNCQSNKFGDGCKNYTFGNECHNNTFGDSCLYFTIGNCCYGNTFGDNLTNFQIDTGVSFIIVNSNSSYSSRLQNVHILSGVSGKSFKKLTINIPDEYLNSSRELIITTKVTHGNRPLTPEDIVMYYADEVVDKQNKQDNTLATTSKEVVGAINELFNGGVKDKSIEVGKLAQAVQDTLKMVGTNVKEVKTGEDLFSLEDGIYSLNGSTYTNYPIGIPFDASAVCILVVTHSNQRATLYGVDGSHSSPILPLVAIGDLTNKRWTGGSFYSFFASDYEVGHKLDQKLDASAGAVKTANLANGAVTLDKIASSVQDTLGKVGMNVEVLPDGTDLLSEDLEEGIYIVDCSKMTNVPSSITKSAYDYALSLLIVDREHKRVMMFGPDTNSTKYPTCAYRHLVQKSWNNTPDSIYSKLTSLQLGIDDSVKKQDLLELTDAEVNNIWDNN